MTDTANVLIVDDEPGIRAVLRRFLRRGPYSVREADSCASALAAFRADPPDVTICDYELPDGNTLELLPRLRAVDAGNRICTENGSTKQNDRTR